MEKENGELEVLCTWNGRKKPSWRKVFEVAGTLQYELFVENNDYWEGIRQQNREKEDEEERYEIENIFYRNQKYVYVLWENYDEPGWVPIRNVQHLEIYKKWKSEVENPFESSEDSSEENGKRKRKKRSNNKKKEDEEEMKDEEDGEEEENVKDEDEDEEDDDENENEKDDEESEVDEDNEEEEADKDNENDGVDEEEEDDEVEKDEEEEDGEGEGGRGG